MTRTREFTDGSKIYYTATAGTEVTVKAGSPTKPRETTKSFPDVAAALKWVESQERSRLRKGFYLATDASAVAAGEPWLLFSVETTYTGALPVAVDGGVIYTGRSDAAAHELLAIHPGEQPELSVVTATPSLIHDLAPHATGVLAQIGQQIWRYDTDAAELSQLTDQEHKLTVLSVCGDRAVWREGDNLRVVALPSGDTVWSQPLELEPYGGHTTVLSVVLTDTHLVVATRPNELVVHDLTTDAAATITGVACAESLAVVGDVVIVCDQYSHTQSTPRLRGFTMATGEEVAVTQPYRDGLVDLAVSPAGRLAMSSGDHVEVLDAGDATPDSRFRPDQTGRRARITWYDEDSLVVRSDSGAVGIYRV